MRSGYDGGRRARHFRFRGQGCRGSVGARHRAGHRQGWYAGWQVVFVAAATPLGEIAVEDGAKTRGTSRAEHPAGRALGVSADCFADGWSLWLGFGADGDEGKKPVVIGRAIAVAAR